MTKLRVSQARRARGQGLTIVAAYEDGLTEARVHDFCNSLEAQLNGGCPLIKQMWPLSELRMPQLCQIAADEAARADVVVVSVHHGTVPPTDIQRWMDQWVARKGSGGPTVLLALLDPLSTGISTDLQAGFKNLARRANMEFLVQTEDNVEDF